MVWGKGHKGTEWGGVRARFRRPPSGAHGARMFPGAFRTPRLVLRPIAPEDAGPIFASYAQDGEVTRFLT